jgi:hypothetical protein
MAWPEGVEIEAQGERMVVLHDAPAALSTAARFTSACSAWASIPPAIAPVAGSMPAIPEQKTRSPATIAWL